MHQPLPRRAARELRFATDPLMMRHADIPSFPLGPHAPAPADPLAPFRALVLASVPSGIFWSAVIALIFRRC